MRINPVLSAVCLLVIGSACAAHAAVNAWNGDVATGNWSVDANWDNGHKPTADETLYITNTAAPGGYHVTLDEAYTSTATNALVIGNAAGAATNTLTVAGDLVVERAVYAIPLWDIHINAGGRMVLADGGTLTRRNGFYGEYNSTDGWSHHFLGLSGGGEFWQTGGAMYMTNMTRQGILVGDTSGSVTSRYVMTGGTFTWKPDVMSYASWVIRSRGRLEISGDAVVLFGNDNAKYREMSFRMAGGVFDLSGQATFTTTFNNWFILGTGKTFLRESAKLDYSAGKKGGRILSPRNDDPAGSEAELTLSDHATFTTPGDGALHVSMQPGKRAILNVESDGSQVLGISFLYIGCQAGYGELNLRGAGYVKAGVFSGLHIGGDDLANTGAGTYASDFTRASATTAAPTGLVRMTDGVLDIGGHTSAAWNYNYLVGLVVGSGARTPATLTDAFEDRLYCGRMEFSGGTITNEGYIAVGAGRATGAMVQTGGLLVDNANDNAPMVVGVAGGHGAYALSNGVMTLKRCLHIGGATTNQLYRAMTVGNYPVSRHDAKGVMTIACADKAKECRLAVTEDITVSSDGAGLLEIVGSGATVTARGLTVSNQCAAVEGGESKLRFAFDADGVSQVALSGALTVAEGAKLEVDASAYEGTANEVRLVSCASANGVFAVENIVTDRKNILIEQRATGIYARFLRGTLISVR